MSGNRNLEGLEFVQRFMRATPPEQVRPPRLLRGNEVIAMGFPPGPKIGKILAALEEAQLNGELGTADEAKSFIRKHFGEIPHETTRLDIS